MDEREKLKQQEPMACDGDFPEGFDASIGIPAQALRTANAVMFDLIDKREWDVPCTAMHILSFAKAAVLAAQAEEREACAKVCEPQGGRTYETVVYKAMKKCAAAIRSRCLPTSKE